MANKKVKECENIEFLPPKFQEELKEQSDKNILATLCYNRFRFSDYAKAHGGFFFAPLEEIAKESLVDDSTVKRRLALLQMKKHIERKSGTNHQCTHYRLSKEIEQLLGIEEEENSANAPLDKIREDKTSLDKLSLEEIRTEKTRLEETRQDKTETRTEKTRQDKTRLEETKSNTNTSTSDYETFRTNVIAEFEKCNTEEDLIATKTELTSNLNAKSIVYSRAFWNRCASTIESIYKQRQLELPSDSVAADLELPF